MWQAFTGYKIVRKGPCASWNFGDKGDLHGEEFGHYPTPPEYWEDALSREYRSAANGGCFDCQF